MSASVMQIEIHERTGDEHIHDNLRGQPPNHDGSHTGHIRETKWS